MTATPTPSRPPEAAVTLRERVCDVAIDHFGHFGFDASLLEMSIVTDVDVTDLEELFGDIAGLRAACDDHLLSTIDVAKTQALTSRDPQSWFSQLAGIETYAPLLSYLVRSLDAGDEPGRARLLATFGGGGFLLYRAMHATPHDMAEVLRDYARDVMMPALELYTYGLMADDSMFQSFLAREAST